MSKLMSSQGTSKHPLHSDMVSRKEDEYLSKNEDVSNINPFVAQDRTISRNTQQQESENRQSLDLNSVLYTTTPQKSNIPITNAARRENSIAMVSLLDGCSTPQGSQAILGSENTPGVAGFLEIEEEPPRHESINFDPIRKESDFSTSSSYEQAIRTSSGLLLTHRKNWAESKPRRFPTSQNNIMSSSMPVFHRNTQSERFEMDSGPFARSRGFPYPPPSNGRQSGLAHARRLLTYARLWVVFLLFILLLGTGVILHSFRHEKTAQDQDQTNNIASSRVAYVNENNDGDYSENVREQIFLLPLYNASEFNSEESHHQRHGARRLLQDFRDEYKDLRDEFEDWVKHHDKIYHSQNEKETRFQIWTQNHHRTIEKNKRHGNCKLTKKPVFGSNYFKDLTPAEFRSQYLMGYTGPTTDGMTPNGGKPRDTPRRMQESFGNVMGSHIPINRHPDVHKRILEEKNRYSTIDFYFDKPNCAWYDMSCYMRWLFGTYLYYGVGTMEPAYDADSYPTAMDWRNVGAVTDVRRQGDCGACWAITAVETVESAYFLSTGELIDLSESEVITCTESCQMCYGGWPQDAFDFIMEQDGLFLQDDWEYDADSLLMLSEALEGNSDEMNEEEVREYMESQCPAGGSGSGSGDGDGNGNGAERYGKIEGYGYATDRCVCYSDGSGCDCDEQNEGLAVRNVASYGPATVCLDASTWQDYDGGIMTAASGCSAAFLDMNHCVQVVGYAYNSVSDEEERSGSGDEKSGSGDGGGSKDNAERVGYWIVRNQWSSYWGMNGFAYLAMGENTCGVLNDMTQAYM